MAVEVVREQGPPNATKSEPGGRVLSSIYMLTMNTGKIETTGHTCKCVGDDTCDQYLNSKTVTGVMMKTSGVIFRVSPR